MSSKDKNILIAEFLGWVKNKYSTFFTKNGSPRTIDELNFNESWDWLIPALKKIDELLYASYIDQDITIQDFIKNWYKTETKSLQFTNNQLKFSTDINEVYDDVIQFIVFYNEYTK